MRKQGSTHRVTGLRVSQGGDITAPSSGEVETRRPTHLAARQQASAPVLRRASLLPRQ
jgi:hypothetical protein